MKILEDYKKKEETTDQQGRERLLSVLERDLTHQGDTERISLFHILCGNNDIYSKIHHIYDFEEHTIKPECLESDKVDFSSGSRNLVKIGFNLYNGFPADISETLSTLDEENLKLAIKAIKIRFNMG